MFFLLNHHFHIHHLTYMHNIRMVLLRPCYVKDGSGKCIATDTPKWRQVQLSLDEEKGEPIWNNDVRKGKFDKTLYNHFKILDVVHKEKKRGSRTVAKEGESGSSCPQSPVEGRSTFKTKRIYTQSSDSEESEDGE